jgi:hypothetical protein
LESDGLPVWLDGVLGWIGWLGALVTWAGRLVLLPGALPERPGALPECPGGVAAWRAAGPLCLCELSADRFAFLAFLAFLACFIRFACEAFVAFVAMGQGPTLSLWRKCAGSAFRETVIVTNGCFFEWVW